MSLGMAFQIKDDIIDVMQGQDVSGKTSCRDVIKRRPSSVLSSGMDNSIEQMHDLVSDACSSLSLSSGCTIILLSQIAQSLLAGLTKPISASRSVAV